MTDTSRVQIDRNICHGRPVIRGTRVPVAVIVGSLAAGMTADEVQREYNLTEGDIQAALEFANELIQQESFHPLPNSAA